MYINIYKLFWVFETFHNNSAKISGGLYNINHVKEMLDFLFFIITSWKQLTPFITHFVHAFMLRSLLSIDTNFGFKGKCWTILFLLVPQFLKGNIWKWIINKLVFLRFSSYEENHCNIMILYVINLSMDHIAFPFWV